MLFSHYTADELTAARVTSMLRTHPQWSSVSVSSVALAPVGTGQMAASYRLNLTYDGPNDGAPDSLIAKLSSTDEASRQFAQNVSAYLREVSFYQRLAPIIETRIPRCHFAEITSDTLGFVLLLEDMGPADTVEQLSGCNPDQADLALGQAAALHGPSWNHPRLRQESWLPIVDMWKSLAGSIQQITGLWLDRFGPYLGAEHIAVVDQLSAHVPSWLTTVNDQRCLWHGDFRLDNMLFDAQGGQTPIAIVDWQSTAIGPGIADVSYFLGNSLSEADRASHERPLVHDYHRRLVGYGVDGYSIDQCWTEYRAHALYGLILTIPVSLGVEATERGDRMFAAMAGRAADQMLANDSYSALKDL